MVCVTINSSITVFPSHPTPNGKLPLSENDQMENWNHFTSIYVYKPSSNNASFSDTITSLKHSLSQVLVPFYPLAGRLQWIGGDRLELDCCAAGAQFIEASTDIKLEDYGDFVPLDALTLQLVPTFDVNNAPIEKMPLFMVQVTSFSCGGLVIGTAMSHTLGDGISATMFLNAWASIERGEKTIKNILQPFHDRTIVLQPQKPFLPPTFPHPEFDEPPSFDDNSDFVNETQKTEPPQVALFRLTEQQVEILKKRANDTNTLELKEEEVLEIERRARPYSRYESIAGHIWICACKARSMGRKMNSHGQPTVAFVSVDTRRRLKTPLPDGFFGNASMISVTPRCDFEDLTTKPLSYAAGKIREGILKCTDEYVKSAMRLMAREEEMGLLRKRSSGQEDHNSMWENPNVYVGGWITIPFYEFDFGWGKPSYVGPAKMEVDGESLIMPASPSLYGSLIVAIRLQADCMHHFKNLFYQNL